MLKLLLLAFLFYCSNVNADKEMPKYSEAEWGWLKGLPDANIPYGQRKPGTLLLNMLIKNEEEHLDRTLPKWAKIIDYWIIGVDDHNTDNSPAIIQKHLGHIPGRIEIVAFDGMGPTWSILVKAGLKHFPEATHGIIADADYMPMVDKLDKMELDVRCSKHMYTIWTQDHRNERKMDWIYRNIPGVNVTRRTHQILEAPPLPNQEVFQTLINLPIEEREGGYGDRSGTKNQRYIEWLEKDLKEFPGDARTLYYLGYAHFDMYNAIKDQPARASEASQHLNEAVEYFGLRGDITDANNEERWFAILKLAEIHERYLHIWPKAEEYYQKCIDLDDVRADPWFYIGQHYRLWGDIPKSLPFLKRAAELEMPVRSLFQWHLLYKCLARLEYARAINLYDKATAADYKLARKMLKQADCIGGEVGNDKEKRQLIDVFTTKLSGLANKGHKGRLDVISKLVSFIIKNLDYLEDQLKGNESSEDSDGIAVETTQIYVDILNEADKLQEFKNGYKKSTDKQNYLSCRSYRKATASYLKFMKEHSDIIEQHVSHKKWKIWSKLNAALHLTCR